MMEADGDRKAYQRDWYEENKDVHLGGMRDRYANDPAYRAAARKRAAKSRAERRLNGPADPQPVLRVVNGVELKAWPMAKVEAVCGVSAQAVRQWESQALIPRPSIPGTKRLYLWSQVQLIQKLASFLAKHRRSWQGPQAGKLRAQRDLLVQEIHQRW